MREQAHDPFNVGNETHVEHSVSLVDNQNFHVIEQHLAPLEMIEQASGSGNQNIDAFSEGGILVGKAHSTDQQRHRQFVIGAKFFKGFGDLCRQFTCRCQNKGAGKARFGAARGQNFDHRQGE